MLFRYFRHTKKLPEHRLTYRNAKDYGLAPTESELTHPRSLNGPIPAYLINYSASMWGILIVLIKIWNLKYTNSVISQPLGDTATSA